VESGDVAPPCAPLFPLLSFSFFRKNAGVRIGHEEISIAARLAFVHVKGVLPPLSFLSFFLTPKERPMSSRNLR